MIDPDELYRRSFSVARRVVEDAADSDGPHTQDIGERALRSAFRAGTAHYAVVGTLQGSAAALRHGDTLVPDIRSPKELPAYISPEVANLAADLLRLSLGGQRDLHAHVDATLTRLQWIHSPARITALIGALIIVAREAQNTSH